ncbi:MAG: hypothetical protein LBS19_15890 [Clostridiales bacterium]|jgi:hypothetical protein|nr:hypothetical protein [Clostridiales bacterium]
MGGFAGFVNYSVNYLNDIGSATNRLWRMAGVLGGCCHCGFDVLEDTGAFVQNSYVPIPACDYYLREEDRVYYLFHSGLLCPKDQLCSAVRKAGVLMPLKMSCPCAGAFFMTSEKRLVLFRSRGGASLYYALGDELVFGTSRKAFDPIHAVSLIEPGTCAVYDAGGLSIKPL